ncbi:hypothetical protein VTN77DRAFT_5251 [Rasamsonia byssochlamydoides]|uniref:uncharacterized protein n=1 Tax=Rasamsonia byssochlamydoides TaxID=89139 RepID=UPI00374377B7
MAPSFRDLIDFLLAEIALCGDQGASPAEILSFIDAFYNTPPQGGIHARSNRKPLIDRGFQERVWTWLTRHPEVSVGKNKEGNGLTLAEALSAQQAESANAPAGETKPPLSQTASPRVFVSEERTWLAITGHEPDESRVLPMEFALLSIIASRKSQGIVQTELVKVSGQDKRSVPKRTDALQQKGYIEKRAVQVKASRTSLCTLRKFVPETPTFSTTETPADRGPRPKHEAGDIIDFKVFIDKLFEILKEYKIIARNDLKRILGFADGWRWRILSRALRKFERIGCVKRVKAQSQYQETMKALHPCVMLIREPTERDLQLFHEDSKVLFSNLEQENDKNAELDDDVDADTTRQGPSATNAGGPLVVKEEVVDEGGRVLPRWTPDRNIHNLIFDVIDSAGTTGRTNADTIRVGFGGFFRRPLENTLSRLVECWQVSQPPHLRHLALVRDTALSKTVTHYVHYSAKNFKKLVDSGAASWEAVEFVPKDAKSEKITVPPVDVVPELDERGLHPIDPSADFVKKGDATLRECVAAAKPADYILSSSDPVAVLLPGGSFTVRSRKDSIPPAALRRVAGPTRVFGRPKGTPNKPASPHQDAIPLVPAKRAPTYFELDDVLDEDPATAFKRQRLSKNDPERFKGMSEKEKLEALGLDETWTEYNIFLIERPGPGVYITPRGKRRPAGQRQGRPKISRIAIFKSPKLRSFSWFVEEAAEGMPDRETVAAETPSPAPIINDQMLRPSVRSGKRAHQEDGDVAEDSTTLTEVGPGPPLKRQRIDGEKSVTEQNAGMPGGEPNILAEDIGPDDSTPKSAIHGKRALQEDVDVVEIQDSTTTEVDRSPKRLPLDDASRKRGRKAQHDPPNEITGTHAEGVLESAPPVDSERIVTAETNVLPPNEMTAAIRDDVAKAAKEETPSVISTKIRTDVPSREASQTPGGRKKKTRGEKGGSVAVLRRKIIMDVVEKSGGAFPFGTELWYPFVTAWMKTKYTEKPDFRTVRSTAKHLIDAGKLRQLTFSGKDSKGVMVTKSIITKPEISPNDPIVKDLQHKMLTSEARFYIPPGPEVDPRISKSSRGAPSRTFGSMAKLPFEPGVTVQLHQKPAFVVAQEKRKGQSIQRRLLQAIGAETPDGRRKPVRLMKIQRPSAQDPSAEGLTSISRPAPAARAGPPRPLRKLAPAPARQQDQIPIGIAKEGPMATIGRIKRAHPISTMAPYAMLMNPVQRFHAPTGTFASDAGVPAYRKPEPPAKKQTAALPQSLTEIFNQAKPPKTVSAAVFDPRSSKFFADNDVISRWEIQNAALFDVKNKELVYINQTMPGPFETAPIEGGIRFDVDEPAPLPVAAPQPKVTRQAFRAMVAALPPSEVAVPSSIVQTPVLLSPRVEPPTEANEALAADQPPARPVRRQVLRRNRFARTMPEALVRKLMNAIVVVRTLAGGLEGKMVDWNLVAKAFPEHDPKFIYDRGKAVLSRNRLQMAKMQSDFQERFIEAYERDEVPRIDYNNLEGYDWGKIVEWADSQVDIPISQRVPDLPATREQFDDLFELRVEPPDSSLDQLYTNNPVATLGRKRSLYAGVPFAIPLKEEKPKGSLQKQKQAELSRLETAKTWIRANVVAGEETYDSADARRSLSRFAPPLIDEALQSLVTERVIAASNRGRTTPGRNFNLTEVFYASLGRKRAIDAPILKRAASFKTEVLDEEFRQQGFSEVRYNAQDGDILAIINLAAERQVVLKAYDPPREMYGLTDGGYETRVIAKDKFRFTVHVRPVRGAYVYGNPVWDKVCSVPPPRGEMDLPTPLAPVPPPSTTLPGKVPLWFDVNGNLVKAMWDQAVAAVVGIVAIRPCIDAAAIASMVKPSMGTWEVELVLEWLARVGVATRLPEQQQQHQSQHGWVVKEWWWLVV